jgi:hypothetical protein
MAGPTDDVFNIGINVRTTGEAGVKALGNIVSELIEKGSNVALNLNFGNSFAKAN